MNTTQQAEALPALIERFRGLHFDHAPDGWPAVRTREITALLDRITELESQLAQRFDAADMATAAAQGFRDGVASLSANAGEPRNAIDRDALIDAIAQGLHGTLHCTRVWEAWHVGTMSQDDFEPVDESETPTEIADAVLALLAAPPAAQAEGWQPIETASKYTEHGIRQHLLLGYAPDEIHEDGFVSQGYWMEPEEDAPDNRGHDGGWVDVHFDFFSCGRSFGAEAYRSTGTQPTHWQPLPAAPGPADGESNG